ncbi:MAG: PQQ-dependent sugar dehydrogenase [Fibrobacteria bacterium]
MCRSNRTWILALALSVAGSAMAQTLPTGLTVEPFYDTSKAGVSFRKDEQAVTGMWEVPGMPQHFLVLGYFGFIWSFYPDTSKPYQPGQIRDYTKAQVANFNTEVMKGWEQGALGGSFDPNFKVNRYFYTIYNKYASASSYHAGVKPGSQEFQAGLVAVLRWKLSADLKTLTRDTTILSMDHGSGYGSCNMVFGKDGMMYITADAYSKNSWDSTVFMRKILRIDVSKQDPGKLYAIPTDNPFFNATNPAVKKEIYAFGFRNTYSIVANYITGSILGGEVGQATWDEVNVIKPGKNYGWANGGDGESTHFGVGIEGPCSANTSSGQAWNETLKNPYSYKGTFSQDRAITCADLTNGTWNFNHSGKDLGGSKTAVQGLGLNCIILSPAFRGDPASPFFGYHFVTDVRRHYFVAIKEGVPDAKEVGGLPASLKFSGDLNHNGITSFSEDSYGNMYPILLSSGPSGAFAWHDIFRMSHPQMKGLPAPRDGGVFPTAIQKTHADRLRSEGFRPLAFIGAGPAWVRMPKDATRLELWSVEGRILWSATARFGEAVTLPGNLTAGPLWARFLP